MSALKPLFAETHASGRYVQDCLGITMLDPGDSISLDLMVFRVIRSVQSHHISQS